MHPTVLQDTKNKFLMDAGTSSLPPTYDYIPGDSTEGTGKTFHFYLSLEEV